MHTAVFQDRVRIGTEVVINKESYQVVGISLWQPDLTFVHFTNGSWLVVDVSAGTFLFGEETRAPFTDPFPRECFFQGRSFAVVSERGVTFLEGFGEVAGESGLKNTVCLYQDHEGTVLLLQRWSDGTEHDLSGRWIPESWISIV